MPLNTYTQLAIRSVTSLIRILVLLNLLNVQQKYRINTQFTKSWIERASRLTLVVRAAIDNYGLAQAPFTFELILIL